MEGGRLGSDAGQHQSDSLKEGANDDGCLAMGLAAGLLASLAFCVLGFLITFEASSDRFCPCVYSILIVLYGIGTVRMVRPVLQRA